MESLDKIIKNTEASIYANFSWLKSNIFNFNKKAFAKYFLPLVAGLAAEAGAVISKSTALNAAGAAYQLNFSTNYQTNFIFQINSIWYNADFLAVSGPVSQGGCGQNLKCENLCTVVNAAYPDSTLAALNGYGIIAVDSSAYSDSASCTHDVDHKIYLYKQGNGVNGQPATQQQLDLFLI